VRLLAADFVISAARASDIPHDGLPQVAVAGRSNVGKSSLINALTRRRIARTSAAPGKTQLANIYRIDLEGVRGPGRTSLYLVDLPGYGYARGGGAAAADLRAVAEAYLSGGERPRPERGATSFRQGYGGPPELQRRRKSPSESERGWGPASAEKSGQSARTRMKRDVSAALLLVDSRHPGLESDIAAARWLASMRVETHIVATKIDKLTRSERARNLTTIGDMFGSAALPVSAASGEGLDELWRMIASIGRDADRDE
jgi:GTP-binding protein